MTDFSTRQRPKRRTADLLAVAIAACALLAAAFGAIRARQAAQATRAAVAEARRGVDESRQRTRVLAGSRGGSDEQRLAALVVLASQAPPTVALAALERALPADVRLEALTLAYGEELQLEMRVRARKSAAYDDFLSRLSASPEFWDVVPGAETRDDSLQATVRARFRGQAQAR